MGACALVTAVGLGPPFLSDWRVDDMDQLSGANTWGVVTAVLIGASIGYGVGTVWLSGSGGHLLFQMLAPLFG